MATRVPYATVTTGVVGPGSGERCGSEGERGTAAAAVAQTTHQSGG